MAVYCTRAQIEDVFGVTNVKLWADLDNDQDDTTITDRITRAIADMTDLIDNEMREAPYPIPFTDIGGSPATPVLIRQIAVKLAAVDLYEARGVQDFETNSAGEPFHRLTWHRKAAMEFIRRLKTGQLKLSITGTCSVPEVIT